MWVNQTGFTLEDGQAHTLYHVETVRFQPTRSFWHETRSGGGGHAVASCAYASADFVGDGGCSAEWGNLGAMGAPEAESGFRGSLHFRC
jgi:hypothetical protein